MTNHTAATPPPVVHIGEEITVLDEPGRKVTLSNAQDVIVLGITTHPGTVQMRDRTIPIRLSGWPEHAAAAPTRGRAAGDVA